MKCGSNTGKFAMGTDKIQLMNCVKQHDQRKHNSINVYFYTTATYTYTISHPPKPNASQFPINHVAPVSPYFYAIVKT